MGEQNMIRVAKWLKTNKKRVVRVLMVLAIIGLIVVSSD